MVQKLAEFQTLTGGNPAKANPKLTGYQVELAQVETEIEKLLDTLIGANATLLSYANSKIEELDAKRQSLSSAIADASVKTISSVQMVQIADYLKNWNDVSFEDKRIVANQLISIISVTSEKFEIEWKM